MRLALIVAMAENGVIGRDGGLPWHISGDLKYFKARTIGKPVVMGRKTHESIGRPLPGRANIVVSRNPDFCVPGIHLAADLKAALTAAKEFAEESGAEEIMVMGGADIYRQALGSAERIYLTEVHAAVEGDARFPDFDRSEWREISRERHPADTPGSPAYSFVVLDRIAPLGRDRLG
jgi:dihydrofolate reductase